jgi:hypothetical protein
MKHIELVYRDDLTECITPFQNDLAARLFVSADVIVFASGYRIDCVDADISWAGSRGKSIFFIGTKSFGYNLNWLIRLDPTRRANQSNRLPDAIIAEDRKAASVLPSEHYISLLSAVSHDGMIPITDDQGRMLSTDRAHLTKFGAKFFGERVLRNSPYGRFLEDAR